MPIWGLIFSSVVSLGSLGYLVYALKEHDFKELWKAIIIVILFPVGFGVFLYYEYVPRYDYTKPIKVIMNVRVKTDLAQEDATLTRELRRDFFNLLRKVDVGVVKNTTPDYDASIECDMVYGLRGAFYRSITPFHFDGEYAKTGCDINMELSIRTKDGQVYNLDYEMHNEPSPLRSTNDPKGRDAVKSFLDEDGNGELLVLLHRAGFITLSDIIRLSNDEADGIMISAVEALGIIGREPVIEPLISRLKKGEKKTKDSLEKVGELAVEPLIVCLKGTDRELRYNAAEVLGRIGDNKAVEPLIAYLNEALSDKDTWVSEIVICALARIKDSRAIGPLISALEDEDLDVRKEAIKGLSEITNENFEDAKEWQRWWDKNKDTFSPSRRVRRRIPERPITN